MRFFLIGFMGSGKSTVGKVLANKLGCGFIDMDNYIVETTGMEIAEIFKTHGEDHFRALEKEALHQLNTKEDAVIAAGGGTPCFFDNMQQMNENAKTVYLQISPKEFVNRVYDPNTKRPLLLGKSKEELELYAREMLEKRSPFYKQAKITVNADLFSPERIADIIIEMSNSNK